jgi:hypothetical protein
MHFGTTTIGRTLPTIDKDFTEIIFDLVNEIAVIIKKLPQPVTKCQQKLQYFISNLLSSKFFLLASASSDGPTFNRYRDLMTKISRQLHDEKELQNILSELELLNNSLLQSSPILEVNDSDIYGNIQTRTCRVYRLGNQTWYKKIANPKKNKESPLVTRRGFPSTKNSVKAYDKRFQKFITHSFSESIPFASTVSALHSASLSHLDFSCRYNNNQKVRYVLKGIAKALLKIRKIVIFGKPCLNDVSRQNLLGSHNQIVKKIYTDCLRTSKLDVHTFEVLMKFMTVVTAQKIHGL